MARGFYPEWPTICILASCLIDVDLENDAVLYKLPAKPFQALLAICEGVRFFAPPWPPSAHAAVFSKLARKAPYNFLACLAASAHGQNDRGCAGYDIAARENIGN